MSGKGYFKDNFIGTVFQFLLRILGAACVLIEIFFFADVVDGVVSTVESGDKFPWESVIIVCSLWLIEYVCSVLTEFLSKHMQANMSAFYTERVISKKTVIPYREKEKREIQELFERVGTDPSEHIYDFFSGIMELSSFAMKIVGFFAVCLTKNVWVSLILLAAMAPIVFVGVQNGKISYEAYDESTRHFRRANYFKRILSSREDAQERNMFGYSDWALKRWEESYDKAIEIEDKANRKVFGRMGINNMIYAVLLGIILAILLVPVNLGTMTVGFYIAFAKAIITYLHTLEEELPPLLVKMSKNRLYLRDYHYFLKIEESENAEKEECSDEPETEEKEITIEFRNVSFSYPESDVKILDNLSLVMSDKKRYAIVGVNGAGKSTLMKLLLGVYDNYEGEILINGKEVRSMSGKERSKLFSVAFQNFARYPLTIRENIGNEAISTDEAVRIAEKIGLTDTLREKEIDFDTDLGRVSEESSDMSGGQWQLITIFRCLVSDNPIQILDEPTSAMDPVREAMLYKLFQEEFKGQIGICITHRMGAAKMCDEIIVLSGGKVAESGSHEILMARNGLYHSMYCEQRSWYE